jgi:uncharacterized protein YndB with AHSA1/START domain
MFKKIVIGTLVTLIVVLVILVIVIALQPEDFHVERKLAMAAPASAVFAQVNDFRNWKEWSPWEKLDPNAKYTYEGPTEGKGAIIKWDGNSEVGEGQMTILESRPHELIKIKLDFKRPMEDTATVNFALKEDGKASVVTWSMDGKNNFIEKTFFLFINMDKMLGAEMEKGLASMKAIVEAPAKK